MLCTSSQVLIFDVIYSRIDFATRTIYSVNFQKLETGDSIIESTTKGNLAKINRLIGEKVQLFDDHYP